MAEKKKRRRFFRFRFFLILTAVLVVAFLFTADPLFNLDFGLIRTSSTAESEALLVEMRDVCALNTVEFIYKSVFPHDFIPEDMDWPTVLRKRREGILLLEHEDEYLEVYDICRDLGITPSRNSYDFVVITSIVKGGFNLAGTVYEDPSGHSDQIEETIRIGEGGIIEIRLPEPVITDFIIEDSSSTSYGYPDMEIDPETWKTLTGFLRRQVETIVREEGILNLAREKGAVFIERMLKDAGYNDVRFMKD